MESLIVPILILAIVAAGVALAARAISRRSGAARPTATGADAGPDDDAGRKAAAAQDQRELARQASARLSAEQHRRIYALIAQGQAVSAIKAYNQSTGQGLRAARDAVVALAAHPQPHQVEQPAQEPMPDVEGQPERFAYRYRAIASKGEITREVSSNMLNDEIYGRIRDMARNGNPEAAATALARHSDISPAEAREFIALLED
ncbi:hypothetical protein V1639_12520 [Pseudarthrobacter sp. J75]|uniref:hypothetical protein n=1 Tax=unclassified Pseudarthrobacter TaxID=2647000 RepID=UPI002E80F357|nr:MULTISPECIES: hypothetical protein [unclassified Pseudarthrobacter]MEE2524413.1 hypothetical protein [Pseudarthrobacter sp. J47]MEE2529844.1 hypothetical protein [Pseudarthrobacter sp. J75]